MVRKLDNNTADRHVRTAVMLCAFGVVASLQLCCIGAQAQSLASDVGAANDTYAFHDGTHSWDNIYHYGAVTVQDRYRPDYRAQGLRMGSFIVYPSAGASVTYDDNIYGTASKQTRDTISVVDAGLRIGSNLPRHNFDFAFGGRFKKYTEQEQLDRAEGYAAFNGSVQINHAHTLGINLSSNYASTDFFSPDNPLGVRQPVPVWHNRAAMALKRDAGRLWGAVAVAADSWRYSNVRAGDGSTVDMSAYNMDVVSSSLTVGYRFSPGYSLVTKLRGLRQTSPDTAPGVDRDAFGYEASAGIAAEINPLIRWSVFAGYQERIFDQNRPPMSAMTGSAEATWLATQVLTLNLKAERSVSDSPPIAGATGLIDDTVRLKLDYEVWRNLLFTIQGEYHNLEFTGTTRLDALYSGRVGLEYLHSKNAAFTVLYEHQERTSNFEEGNLKRNRITVGGKVKF